MCEECRQYRCDSRCPNNMEEEKEYCSHCYEFLEKGQEVYVNDVNEILCNECMERLDTEEIIKFFNLQKEVV